ncbi:MAG: cation transporter [Candidatus Andersenbacteria bacterium]
MSRNVNHLKEKARWLSYFTVGYNIAEGAVSVIAGSLVGSVALIGFGFDSFLESLSGGVMIWRFKARHVLSHKQEERIEYRAIKLIGYSFFVFGTYVLYESLRKLYLQEVPDASLAGIFIAVFSLIIMPVLFYQKRKTARAMHSHSLLADSKQTLACMWMSVALLAGVGLHYLYGWWWADPVAGLFIVLFLFREGYHALKEAELCAC